jgi:diguanylate cyclase (GGDEF)-like protein
MKATHLKIVVRVAALLFLAAIALSAWVLWNFAHGSSARLQFGAFDSGDMDPFTAGSILLSSLGGFIALRRRLRSIGHVIGIIGGLPAAARLIDLARGTDLSDHLAVFGLAKLHLQETALMPMPVAASIAILLCAIAFILLVARQYSAAQVSAALALGPAAASGLGDLLGVDVLAGRLPVATLLAILLCGGGILAGTGHRGALRAILSASLPGRFARDQVLTSTLAPIGFAALFAKLLPADRHPDALPETVVAVVLVAWITVGVTAVIGRRLDILRHRAEAELRSMARRDPLTGLLNRGSMDRTLPGRIARAQQAKRPISFLMCDLDHFKKLNDEHGHAAGDQVLRRTADRISAAVRESDQVFRYGGEEIAVLLEDCGPADAMRIAEKIRESVKAAARRAADPVLPTITISIGAATSEHGESELGQILARADDCLYQAKEGGRDRVQQDVLP